MSKLCTSATNIPSGRSLPMSSKRRALLLSLAPLLAALCISFFLYKGQSAELPPGPEPMARSSPVGIDASAQPADTRYGIGAEPGTASGLDAAQQIYRLAVGSPDTHDPHIQPLLGVISGPAPSHASTGPDLSAQLRDIGVTAIRNQDYFDDRLDLEQIFFCGGTSYPSWEGCSPHDDRSYFWDLSDEQFQNILDGGLRPFLRLGGEVQNAVRRHDFKGPQNSIQEENWIEAAVRVVERYKYWNGQKALEYVDIWTEWPARNFWDRGNFEFISFWARAYQKIKAAHPDLKVGGPGFVAGTTVKLIMGRGLKAQAFLRYLYQNGIRPDWIGWHLFSNKPLAFLDAARAYQDLLDGRGRFSNVEWAGTGFFSDVSQIVDAYGNAIQASNGGQGRPTLLPQERIDSIMNGAEGAAVLTASWIAMQHSGIVGAYYYRAGDTGLDARGRRSVQQGAPGLFYSDPQGSPKPKAHAFRLWSVMVNDYPAKLVVEPHQENGAGGELWVLAGQSRDSWTAVLVANVGSSTMTWIPTLGGKPVDDPNRLEFYQVDQDHDGRAALRLDGPGIHTPPSTVQLVVIHP